MATFGEKLRDLMAERGLSLRKLAPRVPCDPGYLSKVARDLQVPSREMAARIDDALDAGGALAELHTPLTAPLDGDEEERLLLAAARPVRTDLTVVASLATILAAQRRLEDTIGSEPLLEPVRAQLGTITAMVADARGQVRKHVVNVAGQWTQYYGWLCVSIGRLDKASVMLDRALQHAIESDDVNLTSEVLGFKGQIAFESGQLGTMMGLRRAARRDDGRLYPGEAAIAASQEARGHAVIGDATETARLLDLADELAEEALHRQDETPPWLYYQVDGFHELHRGQAWRHLGQHHPGYSERAIADLGAGLAKLPAEMRSSEWAGDFMYHLARAYLQAGEREEAARVAEDLQKIAARVDSTRTRRLAASLTR